MSIKFDPTEITEATVTPTMFGGTSVTFKYPVTPREGILAAYARKPIWFVTGTESQMFSPKVNPDNIARAFAFDGGPFTVTEDHAINADMFGIEWEYIAQVSGSMVRPGKPFIEDANEIAEKVVWPDIETWDWEQAKKDNANFAQPGKAVTAWFLNGWYERLISFMDFEGAVMALFDDDQKDAVHAFFDKLSDLYIKIFDKYLEVFPFIDIFCIHDDWGSQKESFFSPALAAEMIVPYMKKVTDHLHSKGKYCDLHSCGQAYKQVPNFIAAGWDSWSGQPMNDTQKIYEDYGDGMLIGVIPDAFDPATTSDEEQRELAKAYAAKFVDPNKVAILSQYGSSAMTQAFGEALYEASRKIYAGE